MSITKFLLAKSFTKYFFFLQENIIDISSSSSGNESDSEDSDKKDDDIMVLSDEGEPEPGGTAEDPNNSGAHTNDFCNQPDEEGRILVNVGHPPEDPDIFLAPQIARVIKPHQVSFNGRIANPIKASTVANSPFLCNVYKHIIVVLKTN